MNWTFEQSTGRLLDPSGRPVATGYAGGNCGKNPEGKNNPDMQGVKSIGPLPEGKYMMDTPREKTHMGPFAIPLIPAPGNNMLGRGGFYIHGDTTPPGNASEGCIILPRATRAQMWASDQHFIDVVRGGA